MSGYKSILRVLSLVAGFGLGLTIGCGPVSAIEVEKIGVHVLSPAEFGQAKTMLTAHQSNDRYQYVTLPISISAPFSCDSVRQTLNQAKQNRLIPLVRLTTEFTDQSWQIPTKREIVEAVDCLAQAEWPTDQRHLIVFNEVNHAPEWGGRLDPAGYAKTLQFVSDWAHTSNSQFIVMPAALDLAAPNGTTTRDAFDYLSAMYKAKPEIFDQIDAWNSHSYPNPGFVGRPQDTGRTSLRGYQHELAFLTKLGVAKNLPVYITETGWRATRSNVGKLADYYQYASRYVWSDPRVVAVTPFILRGSPGPFAEFSFLVDDQPTVHYTAIQKAIADMRVFNRQVAWNAGFKTNQSQNR